MPIPSNHIQNKNITSQSLATQNVRQIDRNYIEEMHEYKGISQLSIYHSDKYMSIYHSDKYIFDLLITIP